jgi:nucleoid-associated protein YejK
MLRILNYINNKKYKVMFTKEWITKLSEDFVEEFGMTKEKQQKFIEQVFSYANDCCETEQEIYCFIDGLLMDF